MKKLAFLGLGAAALALSACGSNEADTLNAEEAQNMESEPSELSEADDRQLAQAVMALLDELPTERDREILVRFYLDGTDKQQLCQELGLSPKHFDRVLMRARSRLRTIIERRAPHLALFPRISGFLLPLAISFTFWVRDFGS